MNKTQKNWRKYWKNYKPTENDIKYRSARRPSAKQIIIPTSIVIIFLTIALNFGKFFIFQYLPGKTYTTNESEKIDTNIITNTGVISNMNGIEMKKSINRIYEIFNEISTNQPDTNTLIQYITEINSLNLSKEYNDLKLLCVKRIENREKYNTINMIYQNNPTKDLYNQLTNLTNEYNSIDISSELAKTFEKVGVKYKLENGHIYFEYKS